MNFLQKLCLLILIAISVAYVYFSYFNGKVEIPDFNKNEKTPLYHPIENNNNSQKVETNKPIKQEKNIKIFLLDNSGNLKAVNRTCNTENEVSCFKFAIKELISAPTKWEKSKGYTSEIPTGTKILSIRESSNSIMIDLSSNFESGGGAESTYTRVKQIIKTANANTNTPTYLYINGKQANVIGGEGIMIKQPLNERSFDE